jgi:hypothetical protein
LKLRPPPCCRLRCVALIGHAELAPLGDTLAIEAELVERGGPITQTLDNETAPRQSTGLSTSPLACAASLSSAIAATRSGTAVLALIGEPRSLDRLIGGDAIERTIVCLIRAPISARPEGGTVLPMRQHHRASWVERFARFALVPSRPWSFRNNGDAIVPNPLRPDLMTPAERLDEIAEILAAGILRLRARLRAPRGSTGEPVRVDFSPRRSGHVAPSGQRRRSR